MKHFTDGLPQAEAKQGRFGLTGLLTLGGLLVSAAWALILVLPVLVAVSIVAIGAPGVKALHRLLSSTKQAALNTRADHR